MAARSNGYAKDVRQDCVRAAVRDYRAAMAEFAEQRTLDVWYASLPVDKLVEMAGSKLGGKVAKALKRTTDKALTRDSLQAFGKLTETVGDEARFVSHPPLLVPVSELVTADAFVQTTEFLSTALREYRRTLPEDRRHLLDSFRFVDMARKVVGVGSVGTRAWVLLLRRTRQRGPVAPAGEGGAAVGARAVRRARQRHATAGSGWWRGSG